APALSTPSLHDALPISHHRPDMPHHEVVAVGRRFGDGVRGNGAARARAAVDDHRLAPALAELLRKVAREVIGGAARALPEDADRSEEHTSELQSRFDLV